MNNEMKRQQALERVIAGLIKELTECLDYIDVMADYKIDPEMADELLELTTQLLDTLGIKKE